MKYRIYIPTRGRVNLQLTVTRLPEFLHERVTLVCPKDEVSALRKAQPTVSVVAQPSKIQTIAAKRAWIAEYASDKGEFWFQADDDLNLFVWTGEKHRSVRNEPEATERFFKKVLPKLTNDYRCVGLGTKGFALPGGVRENYHLGFVFGFHPDLAKTIDFRRVEFYEDIDYTLQVLRSGENLAVSYDMVVEQRAAGSEGGISDERTIAKADKALEKLIKLHPGIVSRKDSSGQHPFSNTKVSWRRAASLGKEALQKSLF